MAKKQEDQWARMSKKQKDWQARLAEQGYTTFNEVLSQVSQADLARLLTWFLSTTANPGAVPIYSVSGTLTTGMQPEVDAQADDTTPEFEGPSVH